MDFAKRRHLGLAAAAAVGSLPSGDMLKRLISSPVSTARSSLPANTGAAPDTARALAQAFAPDPRADKTPATLRSAGLRGRLFEPGAVRRAFVHNTHTGETLNTVYYEAGRYIPAAMAAAMRVLRDWRNGEEHVMDPGLFDLLHHLRDRLGTTRPFEILSGYRSKATNALMHERSPQVAAKSQHVLGKALDICVAGVDLDRLHRAALSLRAGGVGFYPESGFVHVDVGPVRQWFGT